MTILTRYLIREIIKYFCTVLGVVILIYLAVLFFEKIDGFIEKGVPATRAFWFFLFQIPLIVKHMLPLALLLAILVTFGLMSKRNELIALKSSGVSIFHLFKSVTVLGVLSAGALFFLSEMVVPGAMARSNHIWLQDVEGGAALTTRENIPWIKGDHAFFKINQYDPATQVIYGFTAFFLDDQFQLTRRLDAQRGAYEEGRWALQNVFAQEFDPDTHTPDVSFYSQRTETIDLMPEELLQITPETDEMSSRALRAKIQEIEAEGDNAARYRVDLQNKIAFPVVCLVLCLIGTAIAVRSKLKGGLPVIVSYGIGIAFLYYIVLSTCISFGYGGILHPVVAAWTAHVIFLCAGGVALINAQQQ